MPDDMQSEGGLWGAFRYSEKELQVTYGEVSAREHVVVLKNAKTPHLYEAEQWAHQNAGQFGKTWSRQTAHNFTVDFSTGDVAFTSAFEFDCPYVAFDFKMRFG